MAPLGTSRLTARTVGSVLLAVVVAALGVVTGVLGSSVARAESVTVPADGVVRLSGHGFGHGTGMSVWGAQGAALKGVPYDQILAAYYPGTNLAAYPDRTVRVRLSLDSTQLRVPAQPGLVAVDGLGRVMLLPDDYTQWRLVLAGGGLQLQGLRGSWTPVALGGSLTTALAARFENTSTGIVRVYRPDSSSVGYRGAVFAVPEGGSLLSVLHIRLEQYLRGVVPKESPPSWATAELRAQTVAARTIAASAISTHTAGEYDVCDTTQCQVFGGTTSWTASGTSAPVEYATTDAAVRVTAGQVLYYQGGIAVAMYSASNGGFSTSGGVPYLPAKPDPWSGTAPGDPVHSWSARIAATDIAARYPQLGTVTRLTVTGRDGRGEWGGRVTTILLDGTSGSVTISGSAFMNIRPYPAASDGVRSSYFALAPDPVPFGSVDHIGGTGDEGIWFYGWAIDPDTTGPISVHVYVNGRFATSVLASDRRPDVGAAYPSSGPDHGYGAVIPSAPGPHTVCIYGINAGPGIGNPLLACRTVTVPASRPFGFLDILAADPGGIYVEGWTIDPDVASPIGVHLYADDRFGAAVTADRSRPDVGAAFPASGPNHGYVARLPGGPGAHAVCAYGINVGPGSNQLLGCQTVALP